MRVKVELNVQMEDEVNRDDFPEAKTDLEFLHAIRDSFYADMQELLPEATVSVSVSAAPDQYNFETKHVCSRCGNAFHTLLKEVGPAPVCRNCVRADEWICDYCHQAVSQNSPVRSVASAFGVCSECFDSLAGGEDPGHE